MITVMENHLKAYSISPLHETTETFFGIMEVKFFVLRSSEYETSDILAKGSWFSMQILQHHGNIYMLSYIRMHFIATHTTGNIELVSNSPRNKLQLFKHSEI